MDIRDLAIAKKVNNYAIDATGGGLFTDTTHYRITCPAGKRWFVLSGSVKADVSATVQVHIFDSSDNIIDRLLYESASTTHFVFPESEFFTGNAKIIDAGEYLEILFGAIQGVGAFASCTILEIDI